MLRILEKAVLFFIVIYIAAVIDEYIHTVVYYKAGYYFEIEGVVENYSSVPGRNGTTFTVDGVEFHCPDNSWGYYPTNENSKVIKENGQYLKIRYIPHDIQGNVIVYIEQMIPEDEELIAAGGGYMLAIVYLVILIFLLLYGYLIHRVSPTKIKITAVVVYVISMIFIGIVYDILNMFLLATIAVIFYTGVMAAIGFRKEKKIYHGIESKLRYMDRVRRTEYEDMENIFCRCIVTEPVKEGGKGKLIFIVPNLPPYIDYKYLYFVDYNGNCYDHFGKYLEGPLLYNYAPYNEIAEGLAQEGHTVIRMDMFWPNTREVKTKNYIESINGWIAYVKKIKNIVEDPIVIGHRENGFLAIDLMKSKQWKQGILLCCGLNYNYFTNGKSCGDYLNELTDDYSLIQIDAEMDRNRKKAEKEKISDLRCRYTIYKIEHMDYTLRSYEMKRKNKVNLDERRLAKGYKIMCGTGEFPPVSIKMMEILKTCMYSLQR
ncbi:MAG: hypothetical protein K2N80_03655 [Lachnospiraceae bacterium]|nr:hypothetical protein [Lachnospiraceae bacterium]